MSNIQARIASEVRELFGFVEPSSSYHTQLWELVRDCDHELLKEALEIWKEDQFINTLPRSKKSGTQEYRDES